jgi:hypothetical protein
MSRDVKNLRYYLPPYYNFGLLALLPRKGCRHESSMDVEDPSSFLKIDENALEEVLTSLQKCVNFIETMTISLND